MELCHNERVKQHRKFNQILAQIVSRLFDPILEIPIALLLAVYLAVNEGIRWRFLGVLLFIDLVVPFVFFLTMLYHKQITGWDVRERRERVPLYAFTMLCHLGGVWLAHELGKAELAGTLFRFWLLGIAIVLITTKWKISVHGAVNAFLVTLVTGVLGWQYIWLYALIPVVGWARIYDRHHTLDQYIAGVVVGVFGGVWGLL